jgi:hypothetical protein
MGVVLLLAGPGRPVAAGEPLRVGVEVRNEGDTEVCLVGVVDGSEHGVRYPHWRPTVSVGGRVVAEPGPPEDPLVGPLRRDDFRRLAPGDSFDPAGLGYLPLATFATFRPSEPGTYRCTLAFSTESERPEQWLGRFGQEAERDAVLELVTRVPRLRLRSELEVQVS